MKVYPPKRGVYFRCNLFDIRTKRGLTIKQVALGSGVSIQHIHRLESDLANPGLDVAVKVAEFLGLDWSEIWVRPEGGGK